MTHRGGFRGRSVQKMGVVGEAIKLSDLHYMSRRRLGWMGMIYGLFTFMLLKIEQTVVGLEVMTHRGVERREWGG